MKQLLYLSFLLNISCVDTIKDVLDALEDDDDPEDEERSEGDRSGDCSDGVDNDDDGNTDCEDSGCENKPVCDDMFSDDNDSSNGGSDNSGGNTGGSDDNNGQDSGGSSSATLITDSIFPYAYHAYESNDIVSFDATGDGTQYPGELVVFIGENSDTGGFCALSWEISANTTTPDGAYSSGSVTNAFDDSTVDVWYGFRLTGTGSILPDTQSDCDRLDELGDSLVQQFLASPPSFGYGPLEGLGSDAVSGYGLDPDKTFAGIIGLDLGEGLQYFPIKPSYLYNSFAEWDSNGQEYPQGTEINAANAAFGDGFYVMEFTKGGISFGQ